MAKNKRIPLVIITSLIENEFENDWGISDYGNWVVKDRVNKFTDLIKVYETEPDCESFKKTGFAVPDDVSALILKGNTDDRKPHQFEIIWHLLNIEKCNIDFILIHPGGGIKLGQNYKRTRNLGRNLYNPPSDNKVKFHYHNCTESVPYFCYSFGGGSDEERTIGQWINEIAKAIKTKTYKNAIENLKELHGLLNDYLSSGFNKDELQKKTPEKCLVFEIIKYIPTMFLPLSIDLKGLSELSLKGHDLKKEKTSVGFLKEMLDGKVIEHYSKKLTEARILIFGEISNEKSSSPVPGKYLEKFKDANLKETLLLYPKIRQELINILGYKEDADGKITNIDDNEKKPGEDPRFTISAFSSYMDGLIEKYSDKSGNGERIDVDDVSKILDKYYEGFKSWFKRMQRAFSKLLSELNKA